MAFRAEDRGFRLRLAAWVFQIHEIKFEIYHEDYGVGNIVRESAQYLRSDLIARVKFPIRTGPNYEL